MFPEILETNEITSRQLNEYYIKSERKKFPRWLQQNRIRRGVYQFSDVGISIGGNNIKTVESKDLSVPLTNNTFVPFGIYAEMDVIISSGKFFPVFVTGPTGNGKSTTVEQICAKHNKPMIRVNLNSKSDEESLIGSKTLIDGNVYVVEGPVLIAMKKGYILLLDELDAASPNEILCLQGILEGKPYYFKLTNEWIYPTSGFNIIATANTKGKGSSDGQYIGTNVHNEAFLERFAVTLEQPYPDDEVEMSILLNIMKEQKCYNLNFATTLVKWAKVIRKTFEEGGIDENITPRRLIHIVNAYSMFKDERKAVEMTLSRFDTETKKAFIDVFNSIFVQKVPKPKKE